LCLSSPYGPKGELHRAYTRFWGQDDPRVLVWNADTRSMNPLVDAAEITAAFAEDPVWATSEYGQDGHVAFRQDVQALFDVDGLRAVTIAERRELPPARGVHYVGFVDPAGGSGSDSFTLAIGHAEGGRAVLDLVRETRAPFSPERCRSSRPTLRRRPRPRRPRDRRGDAGPESVSGGHLGDTCRKRRPRLAAAAHGTRCRTTRRAEDSNLYGLAPSGFQDRRLTS
jgi:hypothetical protein